MGASRFTCRIRGTRDQFLGAPGAVWVSGPFPNTESFLERYLLVDSNSWPIRQTARTPRNERSRNRMVMGNLICCQVLRTVMLYI